MKTAHDATRARFMDLVFALEEACQDFGMHQSAEACERVRMARRMVVAAFDRMTLGTLTQNRSHPTEVG